MSVEGKLHTLGKKGPGGEVGEVKGKVHNIG